MIRAIVAMYQESWHIPAAFQKEKSTRMIHHILFIVQFVEQGYAMQADYLLCKPHPRDLLLPQSRVRIRKMAVA
jgi:hypothetical protein